MLDEFEGLFDMLDEPSEPLARLAWLAGQPDIRDVPKYNLYDAGETPFNCQYCGKNEWRSTGDEFVCDHSNDVEYEYCPLPVYDFVKFEDVEKIVRLNNG